MSSPWESILGSQVCIGVHTCTLLDNTAIGLAARQVESHDTRQTWMWRQEIRKLKIMLNCLSVTD